MRVPSELIIEPAASWRRVQQSTEWFIEKVEALPRQNHQRFLERRMLYERGCYLQAAPHQRGPQRTDPAHGFSRRRLATRLGVLELTVPRSRSARLARVG